MKLEDLIKKYATNNTIDLSKVAETIDDLDNYRLDISIIKRNKVEFNISNRRDGTELKIKDYKSDSVWFINFENHPEVVLEVLKFEHFKELRELYDKLPEEYRLKLDIEG